MGEANTQYYYLAIYQHATKYGCGSTKVCVCVGGGGGGGHGSLGSTAYAEVVCMH